MGLIKWIKDKFTSSGKTPSTNLPATRNNAPLKVEKRDFFGRMFKGGEVSADDLNKQLAEIERRFQRLLEEQIRNIGERGELHAKIAAISKQQLEGFKGSLAMIMEQQRQLEEQQQKLQESEAFLKQTHGQILEVLRGFKDVVDPLRTNLEKTDEMWERFHGFQESLNRIEKEFQERIEAAKNELWELIDGLGKEQQALATKEEEHRLAHEKRASILDDRISDMVLVIEDRFVQDEHRLQWHLKRLYWMLGGLTVFTLLLLALILLLI